MNDPRLETPTSVAGYLSLLQHESVVGWNRFWFTPRDPVVLGLIRVLTGLMLIYTHVVWGLQLERFLGPHAILQPGPLTNESGGAWATFWWYVPESSVTLVHWASVAICVLFTLGIGTRVTAVLAWLVTVSYANRLFFATFGLDQINAMLAFYLAISPSGDALSFDRWWRGRRESTSRWVGPDSVGANIGIRLIQLNMCVVYLFAGLAKLEGESWWNGYAMWQAFANYEYQTIDMTWLAPHVYVWNFLTHVTVVWEISFCALVWVRLLRPIVVAVAIPLHVGIGAALGMWTFGLIMLVGCASFLSAGLVRRWLRIPSQQSQRSTVVDAGLPPTGVARQ